MLLNICIYWQHYLGVASFPGDFRSNYYPLVSFWITLVREGIFPEWLPYQNMGLPFLMTMQSGVFYPPLWLFAIPGAPDYSLQAANSVQALHVLWGSIGFWVYARCIGLSRSAALIGAIGFHFFGGFYSNSDSADIVRAYSWLPWLFWVCCVVPSDEKLQRRHWLAPFVVLCVITGSYPGNLASHAFVLVLFVLVSWFQQSLKYPSRRKVISLTYLRVGCLCLVGVGMAAVFLLPAMSMKPLMDRGDGWSGFRVGWMWYYWNTLVMPTTFEGPYVKKTMLSAFITAPLFSMIFLINRQTLINLMPWCLLVLFSLLMAQGNGTYVFDVVTGNFPFLDYSRFPSSDYRGLMCIGLIVLAVHVYDHLASPSQRPASVRRMLLFCAIPAGYLLLFWFQNYIDRSISPESLREFGARHPDFSGAVYGIITYLNSTVLTSTISEWIVYLVFSLVFFVGLLFLRRQPVHRYRLPVFFLVLTIASGSYMLFQSHHYWSTPETERDLYTQLQLTEKPSLIQAIENPPPVRPACIDTMSWRGLLDGSFICVSAGSIISKAWLDREWHAPLRDAMKRGWQAYRVSTDELAHCDSENVIQPARRETSVQQITYGLQSVKYSVKSSSDFCFVETEMFFPGWSGTIDITGEIFEPKPWCGSVRAWCLPRGSYVMEAKYRTPLLREGIVLSLIAMALFIMIYSSRESVLWKRS